MNQLRGFTILRLMCLKYLPPTILVEYPDGNIGSKTINRISDLRCDYNADYHAIWYQPRHNKEEKHYLVRSYQLSPQAMFNSILKIKSIGLEIDTYKTELLDKEIGMLMRHHVFSLYNAETDERIGNASSNESIDQASIELNLHLSKKYTRWTVVSFSSKEGKHFITHRIQVFTNEDGKYHRFVYKKVE